MNPDALQAAQMGIPNGVPENLRKRFSSLMKMKARIETTGLRVTSGYRSEALSRALGLNTEESEHAQCRALDVAPLRPSANKFLLIRIAAQLQGMFPREIENAIVENDHVHVRFSVDALEQMS